MRKSYRKYLVLLGTVVALVLWNVTEPSLNAPKFYSSSSSFHFNQITITLSGRVNASMIKFLKDQLK